MQRFSLLERREPHKIQEANEAQTQGAKKVTKLSRPLPNVLLVESKPWE